MIVTATVVSVTPMTTSTIVAVSMTSIASLTTSKAASTVAVASSANMAEMAPVVATLTMVVSTAVVETTTVGMEEEEDQESKVKKFPFSKQEGVVLECENRFFLGRKEGDSKLLGEEVGWLFFGMTISFYGERTKFGGLKLMMVEIFS